MLIEITNSSPMWSPNCTLLLLILKSANSFIWTAPPNGLRHYGCLCTPAQGIKPHVVYPNKLHRAHQTSFFAATNPTGQGIWILSTRLLRRTLSSTGASDLAHQPRSSLLNNPLSLIPFGSSSCRVNMFSILIGYMISARCHNLWDPKWYLQPRERGIVSTSTRCDTILVFPISIRREMIGCTTEASSNVTFCSRQTSCFLDLIICSLSSLLCIPKTPTYSH